MSVGENAVKVLVDVDSDCVCWVVLELFIGGGVVKVFKPALQPVCIFFFAARVLPSES